MVNQLRLYRNYYIFPVHNYISIPLLIQRTNEQTSGILIIYKKCIKIVVVIIIFIYPKDKSKDLFYSDHLSANNIYVDVVALVEVLVVISRFLHNTHTHTQITKRIPTYVPTGVFKN